jgi:hypothetical protein
MRLAVDDIANLERSLLRRGMHQRAADVERCGRCHRTPLVGERIYVYDRESVRCELCRDCETRTPVGSRVIRGPEFGHTMRITDHRAA